MNKQQHHFLIISCGSQGHINPNFQLAKRLLQAGAGQVTFVSFVRAIYRMRSIVSLEGLSYATFYEENPSRTTNFVEELRRAGSESLRELLVRLEDEGHHVTFLIYTLLLPWAADAARERGIPSAFFCIQSAAALVVYDRWFYSEDDMSPPSSIKWPGFLRLTVKDVPNFLLPDDQHHSVTAMIQEHMEFVLII